jgi:sugar lactone lactonase YvrE
VHRVADLPLGSFPNGLAFHDGALDASDSVHGEIWRVHGHLARPSVLVASSQLAGADGILVGRRGTLYVTSNDNGSVVRVDARRAPPLSDGSRPPVVGRPAATLADR